MPLRLHDSEARGRVIAAGRMLAGLDQTELAIAARVSPSTISNVERGRIEARGATLRAIKRALRDEGVTINVDLTNTLMTANASFEPLDD